MTATKAVTLVDRSHWKWFGSPGHLCVSEDCRFHLCTQVGAWLVSTVGEYLPDAPVREILAQVRGIILEGQGDARRADWLNKNGYEKLGLSGTYETMVFKAGPPCSTPSCGCGLPTPEDYQELACVRYDSRKDATEGHYALCDKWARKETANGAN